LKVAGKKPGIVAGDVWDGRFNFAGAVALADLASLLRIIRGVIFFVEEACGEIRGPFLVAQLGEPLGDEFDPTLIFSGLQLFLAGAI
jgi:hypothetical protein